jgi:hypothetical protein
MSKQHELAVECKRQSENCLYTSTSLFIWLRCLRALEIIFIVIPLLMGFLAGWELLTSSNVRWVRILASICAFLAGLLPVIYAVLQFDERLDRCKELAGEFKNLQDRFRQAALVSSQKPFSEFELDFNAIMVRLEAARSHSYTAPEWCFKKAQKKVKSGDYTFDIDTEVAERPVA